MIQVAKNKQYKNIISIASKKNEKVVMAKGCTHFYDYTNPNFIAEINAKWTGKVDLVYDAVSALFDNPYLPHIHTVLKPGVFHTFVIFDIFADEPMLFVI
jgi:NADPH:quinone reductase-like Zn-dependent oxidoreductase